jgi:hypothetical protein
MNFLWGRRTEERGVSATKGFLQFIPQILRTVARRSKCGSRLPTVRPSTTRTALRRNRTMYATDTVSVAAKLTAFAMALVASVIVLGSTVAGMQPQDDAGQVVALERVTVTATRMN